MPLDRRLVLIALTLAAASPAVAAPIYAPDTGPPLSPRGRRQIKRLKAAIRAEQARQAVLPPPASDAARLVRMADFEQAAREALYGLDFDSLEMAERRTALDEAWALVEAVDRRNQAALKTILPADGWFGRTDWGEDAARAAWLIVIHAVNDRRLMREAAGRMAPLVADAEVLPAWYASVVDRLAVLEGRPQRFGTQPVCRAGAWVVGEVEDPAGLDARRAELGLQAMEVRDFRPPPGC
ncbi:MAG: hypothetical protein Q8L23_17155 [Caulobacter sp.]|nr:hypothetical protein [Caulobacter sp.]